jgi:hypothetical protein
MAALNRHGRRTTVRRAEAREKLEKVEGDPADPPELSTVVHKWRAGDEIPLGNRSLRVAGVRDHDADQPPVLVVEDVAERSTVEGATSTVV